jgi:hypothetical protein
MHPPKAQGVPPGRVGPSPSDARVPPVAVVLGGDDRRARTAEVDPPGTVERVHAHLAHRRRQSGVTEDLLDPDLPPAVGPADPPLEERRDPRRARHASTGADRGPPPQLSGRQEAAPQPVLDDELERVRRQDRGEI